MPTAKDRAKYKKKNSSTAQRKARAKYNKKPAAKKKRAENNRARREAIRKGKARKGDGKDVHHTKGNKGRPGPTRVISRSKNRSMNGQRKKK
jgi:hypothetical protein